MFSKQPILLLMHLLRAKFIHPFVSFSTLAAILVITFLVESQPAKGANKFLGNITTSGKIRSDFMTYWNQITPENESKWDAIEGKRGTFNWSRVDSIKSFAERNGIPWKFHTLVWGSQYPGWITGLSKENQLAAVETWMDSASKRYPDVEMIDVVNEAYPGHAPAPYRAALGGDGATGFDWIFKAFELARKRWPKAILIYNDYNNIEWNSEVAWTVKMMTAAKAANAPIDAIGCQSHDVYNVSTATVKSNIDKLAATGYPIIISEYDIGQGNDATQKKIMAEQFTMMWNHPKIIGITYWGYIAGATWRANTGLMSSSGTERAALTWLKEFVKENPEPPNDYPDMLKAATGLASPRAPAFSIYRGSAMPDNRTPVEVFDLRGRLAGTVFVNNRATPFSLMAAAPGSYVVHRTGSGAGIVGRVK